jgi:ElaB/YqjD/DUF883 family membrane-anchored ribosome-binding protein
MPDQNDNLSPTGGTLDSPPAGTDFQPAPTLQDAGVDFEPAESADAKDGGSGFTLSRQSLKDNAQKLQAEAGTRARGYADEGKARAGEALGQVSQLLNDAAAQVDEKIGSQYGQYARSAAGQVQTFADQLNAKSVDELVDDVRALVRKSPAVAIGAAAAVGFVVARVLSAGLDTTDRA